MTLLIYLEIKKGKTADEMYSLLTRNSIKMNGILLQEDDDTENNDLKFK